MSKSTKVLSGLGCFLTLALLFGGLTRGSRVAALFAKSLEGSSCPFGGTAKKSPALIDEERNAKAVALRGLGRAKHACLLGLTLSESSRKDIAAWAGAHAVSCQTKKNQQTLECKATIPTSVAPCFEGAHSLTFFVDLDRHDTLKTFKLLADFPDARLANDYFALAVRETTDQIGRPHETEGTFSSAYLGEAVFRQTRAHFHTEDLYARLSATYLSKNHFSVVRSLQGLSAS